MKTIIKMVSSGFYLGYSPVAPGTIGSLLGLGIYILMRGFPVLYILVTVLLFILGFLVCTRAEEVFGEKDSRHIIIDEVAAICLIYLFVRPEWPSVIAAFAIFRFFDIMKIPPARQAEKISGGKSIMLDDIVAAFYTIGVILIIYFLKAKGILPGGCILGLQM